MSAGTMAKKKPAQRSAKNKERSEPGFTSKAVRMSDAYAEWLERAAKHNRMTVAAFLDKAAINEAKSSGFAETPPERIP